MTKKTNQRARDRCRAEGTCTTCRREPARPGRTKCKGCAEKQVEYMKKRVKDRRDAGECADCKMDMTGEPAPLPLRCAVCNERVSRLILLGRSVLHG